MGLVRQETSRQRAADRRLPFEATRPSRQDGGSPSASLLLEVRPPSLFGDDGAPRGLRSLLPRLSGLRDWLQTGWSSGSDLAPPNVFGISPNTGSRPLQAARAAFGDALNDIPDGAAETLACRAAAAPSLRELWHLRNALFTLVAVHHCESIAHQRLAALNACFPGAPRAATAVRSTPLRSTGGRSR